ncbi:hypothetical protein CEXT_520121 [Caerostris extrusa]|uniref:Uncharacterized protein n=1 Tax=Caerostris extrusa TaxID=172846 RepID=A0AAV4N3T8_CAEEX|nr:hypothetical protein CEXT_520121 [Caerostris extrusa]
MDDPLNASQTDISRTTVWFARVHKNFSDYTSLKSRSSVGRPRSTNSVVMEENTLDSIVTNHYTSIRTVASAIKEARFGFLSLNPYTPFTAKGSSCCSLMIILHICFSYSGHSLYRRIGCSSPVPWTSISPDLSNLDFFLVGALKAIVYHGSVEINLVTRVFTAIIITETVGVFDSDQLSRLRVFQGYLASDGANFELLL